MALFLVNQDMLLKRLPQLRKTPKINADRKLRNCRRNLDIAPHTQINMTIRLANVIVVSSVADCEG